MRRWSSVLAFLLSSLGCAMAQSPNRHGDPSPEASADDDAWTASAGWLGNPTASADDASPILARNVDDSGYTQTIATETGGAEASATVDATDPSARVQAFPPFDPGEGGLCAGALRPGDIVIVEMMIESVAGSGDHGEWVEVQSTVGCAIDIRGLHGDAPSGGKVRRFDVTDDLWIPAFGRFIVVDSNVAAINHGLPGTVLSWFGQPGDVLRNKGGTVTLRMNGVVIDSVTYPSVAWTIGASLAFPADCPPSRRADWAAWQTSTASWFPGFYGSPNAPNTDVQCP